MLSVEARWSCSTLYEQLDWREESWGSDIVNRLVFHYHLYNLAFKLILLRFNGVLSIQSGLTRLFGWGFQVAMTSLSSSSLDAESSL